MVGVEESDVAGSVSELNSSLAGRYSVIRAIGAGGMAEVYLATDLRHDRMVALKVVRPEWAGVMASQRFLREISIAAKLAHPNIVPLYDSGRIGSVLYYVMPYVEGESLRERMGNHLQLPLEESLQITFEIADALAYAHARGIVHRDIKPDNILLESGHAVVADFGIAKAVEVAAGDSLTTGRIAIGTLAYMSPEQASADGAVDARSDLYSLALVLYEMLTGDVPFHAPSADSMLARKAMGKYSPVSSSRETVPEHLDTVIARALHPDPAHRFASVAEFTSALRASDAPRVKRQARLRRWGSLSLAGVALVGIAVAAVKLRSRVPVTTFGLGRVVVAPLENRTGEPSLNVIGLMASDWITEGLQKTGVVEIVPTPTAFQASRYLAASGDGDRSQGPVRALAAETGAGTVVGGAFYRQQDRLLFRVNVADRGGKRLIVALTDVPAPVSNPLLGVEEVRNRLMGWLAVRYDERLQGPAPGSDRPPTYEAYRAFSEAMTLYIAVENAQALPLFLRAFELDSSFTPALLYASISLSNLGQWARADSLLNAVSARRESLSKYDRAWLDYRLGFVRGNREQALAAIREAAREAPLSKAAYNHAVEAFLTGHVREALRTVEALPSDRGAMRGFSPYWDIYGAILHALGFYDREYDVGLAARQMYPDRLTRFTPLVRAQAARGQLGALARTMREAAEIPTDPVGWDYGHLLGEVAEELRAHRHENAATVYLEQLRQWLQANDRVPSARWRLVKTLYAQGQFDSARVKLVSLRRADPGNAEYLGMTGLLNSRMGEVAAAQIVMDSLALRRMPYEFGAAKLYRARIAATLGLRDDAVASLREAFSEGRSYELGLHRDIDFEPLRGYPPFEQLERGKD
jgi:tetratricopeptide (TPR) repeat protein